MTTDPLEGGRAIAPSDRPWPLQARTAEQEQFLTDLARNGVTGRRWLCRLAHFCVVAGAFIAATMVLWDHVMSGLDHAFHLVHRPN